MRLALLLLGLVNARSGMVKIPAGSYQPLYKVEGQGRVAVASFSIDARPVTRDEYFRFTAAPRGASPATGDSPITNVTWHEAKAYCEARGKRLPTTAEWEYVAAASESARDATRDTAFVNGLIKLYAMRSLEKTVRAAKPNVYGVYRMHDTKWEWTSDFDGSSVHSHSHHTAEQARDHASCAGAASGATDPLNYPAFLRSAVRAGLTRTSSLDHLGFRCAV